MRLVAFALLLFMTACAPKSPALNMDIPRVPYGSTSPEELAAVKADLARRDQEVEEYRWRRGGFTGPVPSGSPSVTQENELLARALTNSPDYTAAVRRAAAANVDAAAFPQSSSRQLRTESREAREQRISAEEARLSNLIERRRREQLALRGDEARATRDQQTLYACQARGAQMEAAYNNPRSILNLEATATGAQTRNACLENYQRTGGF
ncbi:hypothetical protein [Muricoccus nepalensis]|uniref:hypothetical protein n=1 Tax=Muricoccus nepalensis TaxID=1854500 RepID=UPI00112D46A4|nr:hypothetical protein [Roseomonas nepalensis]